MVNQNLDNAHKLMKGLVEQEPENIVVLYYYAVTCLLVQKLSHCEEALRLLHRVYQLNFTTSKYLVMEFFKAKAMNLDLLLSRITVQIQKKFVFPS